MCKRKFAKRAIICSNISLNHFRCPVTWHMLRTRVETLTPHPPKWKNLLVGSCPVKTPLSRRELPRVECGNTPMSGPVRRRAFAKCDEAFAKCDEAFAKCDEAFAKCVEEAFAKCVEEAFAKCVEEAFAKCVEEAFAKCVEEDFANCDEDFAKCDEAFAKCVEEAFVKSGIFLLRYLYFKSCNVLFTFKNKILFNFPCFILHTFCS